MAELQTIAAVSDLLKLAYQAGIFLNKVKDADKFAIKISERLERLRRVLSGIENLLHDRDDDEQSSQSGEIVEEILRTVSAITETLKDLANKVGGFEDIADADGNGRLKIIERFKIALRHPSITRISLDLEARVQILSTNLSILQLFDQRTNHRELREMIEILICRVSEGNKMKQELMTSRSSTLPAFGTADDSKEIVNDHEAVEDGILDSLTECLKFAEDVLTSEHIPDDRSNLAQEEVADDIVSLSNQGVVTPLSLESQSHIDHFDVGIAPDQISFIDSPAPSDNQEEDVDIWPLEILTQSIAGHTDRVSKEIEAKHFEQAEYHLNQAISYAKLREEKYDVAFDTYVEWQEQLAWLLQKQKKWAEAVATVFRLLRERAPSVADGAMTPDASLIQARCHQLLGSIFFDRHVGNDGNALSNETEDIANAETYARRAFNKRWNRLTELGPSAEEVQGQNGCIQLLVQILETRDKIVEANQLKKYLTEDASSVGKALDLMPASQSSIRDDSYSASDKHEMLIEAIRASKNDKIHAILSNENINPGWTCSEGKTLLMHAIEQSNQQIVNKLLDPEIGADFNAKDRDGLTALHFAAIRGEHQLAKCLLKHGALVDSRDNKAQTPVVKAVQSGDRQMVQVLFDADDKAMDVRSADAWSLIHHSVRGSRPELTRFLLNLWPSFRYAVDVYGKTALHHSIEREDLTQAMVLLQHKHAVDVNAVDKHSRTALCLIASKPATERRDQIVNTLVAHGAQMDDDRKPLKWRDYAALRKPLQRRASTVSRTSVSTDGTADTNTSSGWSKLSHALSRRS